MEQELTAGLDEGQGQPFASSGFGNWMADKIGLAGLPSERITHGLRKAAARRLADVGCSSQQIASITGHRSLSEIENYVRAAEQKRLARDAMDKLT